MRAALILIAFVTCAAAQETTPNTIADEFRAFTEETSTQCKSVRDQLAQFKVKSEPLTGYNLRDAVQSLCVCMPGKAEALRADYTADELAQVASQENFVARFKAAVIDVCAAEQLRSMYGEECPQRFKPSKVRAPTYCACMKALVSGYSDATAAEIANAAADYLPEAAAAEQDGRAAPPRPPVLESYWQADQACKARKKH